MAGCQSKFHYISVGVGVAGLVISLFPATVANNQTLLSPLLNLSWGMLFGSTIWAGFISRKVLISELPPHYVGKTQKKSFSILYDLSTLMSSCLLIGTVGLAPHHFTLRIGSTISLISSLGNSLFFGPKTAETMDQKFAIEERYGVGMEVGKETDPEVLGQLEADREYVVVRKQFRTFHSLGMLCGIVGFVGLVPYLFA